MKPEQVKEFIKSNGLKKGWAANQVKIHPTIFSDYLCNRRILNEEQIDRLREFIQKYPSPSSVSDTGG